MRILHVVATYLPAVRYGGTIVSVHGLCKALAARGHDVHVFTTSVDGPQDSDVPYGVPVAIDGVKVWYFRSRWLRRLYWSPPLARRLASHVRDFDLVHTHAIYLWPLWAAARQARRDGVPYIVSLRGMLEQDLIDRKSRLLKAAWIQMIEKRSLENASAIHVTSRREAEQAAAFGFRLPPFREVPNGVDLAAVPTTAVSTPVAALIAAGPFLLFLGRINWKKGLDRLIRALAFAPSVRLVIAGNDEEGLAGEMQRLAVKEGVSDRIAFAGALWGADKAALLSGADALVLPSYSENFGNVVIEAMAAGCPVIVTPEVGTAEIVRDSGAGRVVNGNPAVLGPAIAALMADAPARRDMGERGRRVAVQQFTWEAVAGRMEQVYESILGERKRPA